jgi:hypothetical protein
MSLNTLCNYFPQPLLGRMLTKPPWILPLDVIPHLKTNWLVTSFCIESPNGEAGTAALTSNITAAVHEDGNVAYVALGDAGRGEKPSLLLWAVVKVVKW